MPAWCLAANGQSILFQIEVISFDIYHLDGENRIQVLLISSGCNIAKRNSSKHARKLMVAKTSCLS